MLLDRLGVLLDRLGVLLDRLGVLRLGALPFCLAPESVVPWLGVVS